MFRHRKNLVEFGPEEIIYREGDPADALFVVVAGEVELSLNGGLLGVEGEGGIIGEMALLDGATRNSTAIARGGAKLAKLDRGQFQQLIGENPEFALRAMSALANRLRAVDRFIVRKPDP